MTEIFVDSTFGTNKHGYELYCLLTEFDLIRRGVQEEDKRGTRLTAWFTALRAAGLNPNVVHTDKDFAEVTAASIAFKRNNDGYNHHLCIWHSLRAIDQYITALPQYLHFLSHESDWILSNAQVKTMYPGPLRAMIKRHLLRHPLLPMPVIDREGAPAPEALQYQTYEEIHSSSVKEMLEYCKSIDQPKLFRPDSNAAIPVSRTTMRLESHWRILKKDYGSRFIKPRLDVLVYIICTGLVRSRIQGHLQVEAGREKPSTYNVTMDLDLDLGRGTTLLCSEWTRKDSETRIQDFLTD
ncbi:hypothetical protein POJ06DRAFT_290670 [Lipomyces tetrasporus]|uniref:MULE transposase domain-containing protein n=1 Tax=Lipomyces tetrasporus TaxID=54092 RepID=A0AAD7VSW5_9ASCO|nr:uncharacterized protein POJ06DRAFT_290670 [Lipomyces tetrasporus]KAJ8100823.1 hypothetical protein POJ06DRAFT_290670 [Lipomyces tetrasporus]